MLSLAPAGRRDGRALAGAHLKSLLPVSTVINNQKEAERGSGRRVKVRQPHAASEEMSDSTGWRGARSHLFPSAQVEGGLAVTCPISTTLRRGGWLLGALSWGHTPEEFPFPSSLGALAS